MVNKKEEKKTLSKRVYLSVQLVKISAIRKQSIRQESGNSPFRGREVSNV